MKNNASIAIIFFLIAICGAAVGTLVQEKIFGEPLPADWQYAGDWTADNHHSRSADNFDNWRVDTGDLGDELVDGSWTTDRLVVTMPGQQVYIEDLLTTTDPRISVSTLMAFPDRHRPYTYLPW